MGTKYSSNTASGYNATPPADDGTVSDANKVKWSTVKTKLADPVKDLVDTINTELGTHFDRGPTALSSNTTLGASHFNQIIQVSGAVTLTLTDASTLATGWYCDIHNTDTSASSISRATAGNTIDASSADTTILPLESLRLFVNAAANGFITDRRGKTLTSPDAGAGINPVHTLFRDSASPAVSDLIGGYNFDGRDSAGNRDTYAGLYAEVVDPGTTSEDGRLHFRTVIAGTLASRGYIGDGAVLGSATGGDQGAGTLNAVGYYDDGVAIPTQSSTDTLTNKTLTSPVINAATGIGQAVYKRKTANESVTSSTTLQNDDHLTFAIAASEEYIGTIHIDLGVAQTTTGYKVAITVPSGATLETSAIAFDETLVLQGRAATSGSNIIANTPATSGTTSTIIINFWVVNSTNAGSVTLQWAQNVSNGSALTFNAGSSLLAHRVA